MIEGAFTDLFDDHVRGHLLPRVMYVVEQSKKGNPMKDFLDLDDEIEAYELLAKIGRVLGVKGERK